MMTDRIPYTLFLPENVTVYGSVNSNRTTAVRTGTEEKKSADSKFADSQRFSGSGKTVISRTDGGSETEGDGKPRTWTGLY